MYGLIDGMEGGAVVRWWLSCGLDLSTFHYYWLLTSMTIHRCDEGQTRNNKPDAGTPAHRVTAYRQKYRFTGVNETST